MGYIYLLYINRMYNGKYFGMHITRGKKLMQRFFLLKAHCTAVRLLQNCYKAHYNTKQLFVAKNYQNHE